MALLCPTIGNMRSAVITANIIVCFAVANSGLCGQSEFFVSPLGNDSNPGTKTRPFKTLDAARNAARKSDRNQKRIVWLRKGIYEKRTLHLWHT